LYISSLLPTSLVLMSHHLPCTLRIVPRIPSLLLLSYSSPALLSFSRLLLSISCDFNHYIVHV
jgi:hypothetical protein